MSDNAKLVERLTWWRGRRLAQINSGATFPPKTLDGSRLEDDLTEAASALEAQGRGEVVGWVYEMATQSRLDKDSGERTYSGWGKGLTFAKPNMPEGSIRNLKPLGYLHLAPLPPAQDEGLETTAEDLSVLAAASQTFDDVRDAVKHILADRARLLSRRPPAAEGKGEPIEFTAEEQETIADVDAAFDAAKKRAALTIVAEYIPAWPHWRVQHNGPEWFRTSWLEVVALLDDLVTHSAPLKDAGFTFDHAALTVARLATPPADRDAVIEAYDRIIAKEIASYEDVEAHGGLTEMGAYGYRAIVRLRDDIAYAVANLKPVEAGEVKS